MADIISQVIYALVIAIVYGLASFFKEHDLENFSVPMFAKTLVVAVVVTYVMFQMKLTYDQALQFVVTNTFLMTFIDDLINKIFKLKASLKPQIVPSSFNR